MKSAQNYEHWQKTYASDAPTLYISVHFFNLTNLEDVRNGALPIVQEVGPYVYWYVHVHCDHDSTPLAYSYRMQEQKRFD